MANRLTEEDKIRINELYIKYGTYAEVARQTGFSPATVRKYIIPNFTPKSEISKRIFTTEEIPLNIDLTPFIKSDNLGEFCVLSKEEEEEIKELWKEMVI